VGGREIRGQPGRFDFTRAFAYVPTVTYRDGAISPGIIAK